jgi:signal transduction histidine kinase
LNLSFRSRLLTSFASAIALSVAVVSMLVWANTRRTLQREVEQRISALVAQFQRQFGLRSDDVAAQIAAVAASDQVQRIAVDASRPGADLSVYLHDARSIAAAQQLDFLELLTANGTIISSAQAPARFGYKDATFSPPSDAGGGAFLHTEALPEGSTLALEAERAVRLEEAASPQSSAGLYIIGGIRVGRDFLGSLVLPTGMRAMIAKEPASGSPVTAADFITSGTDISDPQKLEPLIDSVRQSGSEQVATVQWLSDTAAAETVYALPLFGAEHQRLAILLVGSARREIVRLQRRIGWIAVIIALLGVALGIAFAAVLAEQVARPLDRLAHAASDVASGNLKTQVSVTSDDEIGRLATTFNRMTRELHESRDRLIQAERVAAWRELARRLAHELKNPLFPLQLTIESLARAREQNVGNFDEILHESTETLAAELANLKAIIRRFSDFAKTPAPQLQPVDLNQAVTRAAKVFEAQLVAPGRAAVELRFDLDQSLRPVEVDSDLLHRAISNLILNALDAMAEGGVLTLRTGQENGRVRLEVSDSGTGITEEEVGRLFTPYYTTKRHGTGLGLAFVQSVVSDHGGKVSVRSSPGHGATFVIELPGKQRSGIPD